MPSPSTILTDPARLAALRHTGLLDTPPEEAFDRLTRLAAHVLGAPVAVVSLVDADRQFFKSGVGLAEAEASTREAPVTVGLCPRVVATAAPLFVADVRRGSELSDPGRLGGVAVAAYAGVPLATSTGHVRGTLASRTGGAACGPTASVPRSRSWRASR